MGGKRLEVTGIGGEHRSSRLREGYDQRIDCGAAAGTPAQQGGSASQRFGDDFGDVASLQESILDRVAPRMTLETLDEYD